MRSQFTTIIALLVIGGLCGLALTQTYESTRQPVTENRIRQAQVLLSELLQRQAPTDLKWQQGVANACGDWQFVRGSSPGYAGSSYKVSHSGTSLLKYQFNTGSFTITRNLWVPHFV